jgi:protein required for attachment to host cells
MKFVNDGMSAMKRKTVWIVVANKARARIFSNGTIKSMPLTELYDLVDPESRLHRRDMMSDRPGRSHDRFGRGRHSVEQRNSMKWHGSKLFATRICAYLEQAHRQNKFDLLILVASAEFTGLLRRQMGPELKLCIQREIHKNVSTLPVHAVPGLLSRSA